MAEIFAALIACLAMFLAGQSKKKQAEIVEIFKRLNHLETEVARLEGSVRLLQTKR